MLADIAWWFGWSLTELNECYVDEINLWLKQAQRQIKARYSKAAI